MSISAQNSRSGSTNGVSVGREYLFAQPMADEGRVQVC